MHVERSTNFISAIEILSAALPTFYLVAERLEYQFSDDSVLPFSNTSTRTSRRLPGSRHRARAPYCPCATLVAVTRRFNILTGLGMVLADHAVLPGSQERRRTRFPHRP